jgi:hypothetical protein
MDTVQVYRKRLPAGSSQPSALGSRPGRGDDGRRSLSPDPSPGPRNSSKPRATFLLNLVPRRRPHASRATSRDRAQRFRVSHRPRDPRRMWTGSTGSTECGSNPVHRVQSCQKPPRWNVSERRGTFSKSDLRQAESELPRNTEVAPLSNAAGRRTCFTARPQHLVQPTPSRPGFAVWVQPVNLKSAS